MAMQRARWGPWVGGLNLRDVDVAEAGIPGTQLRALLNLDATDSGVLIPRRGVRRTGGPAMYTEISGAGTFVLLGGVEVGAIRYAVVGAHNGSSPGATFFHYANDPLSRLDAGWPAVATTTSEPGKFCAVVQYNGKIYFIPDASSTGQGWSRTALDTGGFTSVPDIPKGDEAFMIRERLFVIDWTASRVYYSKATDPTVWAAPDGGSFDVNPGDGQPISATAVVNSQLYVFKKSRSYLFTFTADPGIDGGLTLINDQLGALDAIAESNGVLVVNDHGVWRLLNNYFSQLDLLVNLQRNFGLPFADPNAVWLSLEGDNLVVGPAQVAGDYTHAALNLHTGAWSGRTYPDATCAPSTRSINSRDGTTSLAIVYGHKARVLSATRFTASRPTDVLDLTSALAVISPRYRAATGEFDADDPSQFKRMQWIFARLKNALAGNDAAISLIEYHSGAGNFDLTTIDQTAAVPAGTWGGKVTGLVQYRFLSTVLELSKAQTTLSPTITDPTTASDLWIRSLHGLADDQGGSPKT
jgi:hypothetical protein